MSFQQSWVGSLEREWQSVLGACPVAMDHFDAPRPLFFIGWMEAWAPQGSAPISAHGRLALILELVSSTLRIHTEVTEQNRRGGEGRQRNKTAILCGDYLYTRALEFIPDLENPAVEAWVHSAVVGASRGRLLSAIDQYVGGPWEALQRPRRKRLYPGALMRAALGATLTLGGLPGREFGPLNRHLTQWLRGGKQPLGVGLWGKVAESLESWPLEKMWKADRARVKSRP